MMKVKGVTLHPHLALENENAFLEICKILN